jgi:hypothetical protein
MLTVGSTSVRVRGLAHEEPPAKHSKPNGKVAPRKLPYRKLAEQMMPVYGGQPWVNLSDAPLGYEGLPSYLGPATRRSDAYRGGTCTR